ncbi:mannose-1-phosphate guanylyltransferase/mannose-6-phosphate isomerase [Gammaproteobacteria bacterium]|nr:mannose-1-phosphate guanylyltransferase/mannose-6-phosphate isomerase [Gammaproteobacteria bacterium]
MKIITPVVLCGGSGTRLWPLSRTNYPKQFIKFNDDFTLFQKTIIRLQLLNNKFFSIDEVLIMTNEKCRYLVVEQLEKININLKFRIILEPISLNTAPSLTLASLAAPDSNLVVLPSDHYIKNDKAFKSAIHKSIRYLEDHFIFLLGSKPKSTNTSYGYITFKGNEIIKNVTGFIEKPDSSLASKLIANENCLWNLGTFILRSNTWLNAISTTNKLMYENIKKSWKKKTIDNLFERPHKVSFSKSPSNSIDYAVIEKALSINLKIKLIELKTEWSDLGEFSSLDTIYKKNSKGNTLQGSIFEKDTRNTTVIGANKNISLLGVRDLIIVDTKDALLIINKNSRSSMKELINMIKKINVDILTEHTTVHRPWGKFDLILNEKNSKIKKITVKPKSELSYQSHKYRNEHWIILKGIATIKKNGKIFKIKKDESTYIAKGDKHRLINNENIDLEIIEVQTGVKVSEQDIIRYDDIYGRN